MIRNTLLRQSVCRALSTSAVNHKAKIPAWMDEKLRSENLERSPQNVFQIFKPQHGISPDFVIKMQKDYDLSWKAFQNLRVKRKEGIIKQDQRFVVERVQALGAELAAATFLVYRGAAVKFHEFDTWVAKDEHGKYDLPKVYTEGYTIEAVDMGDFHIIYDGFQNLAGLENLKALTLRNGPYVDDWCIDFISSLFHNSLEYLDISNCPRVTERCFGMFHRFKMLKSLELQGMTGVKNPELMTILLEETLPNCQIKAIDYMRGSSANISQESVNKSLGQ